MQERSNRGFHLINSPHTVYCHLFEDSPQNIARRGNYGAFLAESDDGATVCRILTALRRALPDQVAVSAKIRLPLDASRQRDRVQRHCATGVNFLTVHGRDLTENKTAAAGVHLDRIREAVMAAAEAGVPVIANGGVETGRCSEKLLRHTGAAAVMSAEGLLERPNLFATDGVPVTPRGRFEEQSRLAESSLRWCRWAPPVPGAGGANGSFNVVRGHLFRMLYRYWNDHPGLRDELACRGMRRLDQAEALLERLRGRYNALQGDGDWEALPSSAVPDASWYRRHRKRCDRAAEREGETTVADRKRQIRRRIAGLRAERARRIDQRRATV